MLALGAAQFAVLLTAVAMLSAASGYAAAARRHRRPRRYFVLGFLSGVVAGARLRRRGGLIGRARALASVRRVVWDR